MRGVTVHRPLYREAFSCRKHENPEAVSAIWCRMLHSCVSRSVLLDTECTVTYVAAVSIRPICSVFTKSNTSSILEVNENLNFVTFTENEEVIMAAYTIRQVSQMFGLPASTLRYYEEIGLLPVVEKTKAKQRIYTEEHINRLGAVCCFKETGMSMAKLLEFFAYEEQEQEHIDEILVLLREQEKHVAGQIEKLKSAQKQLNRKLNYYKDIKKSVDNGSAYPCWADYWE